MCANAEERWLENAIQTKFKLLAKNLVVVVVEVELFINKILKPTAFIMKIVRDL